ncbi:MAG: SLC13 family permease [Hyphomicrobiaceae bacterium]
MITLVEQHKALIALFIVGVTFAAFLLERFPPAVVAICGAAAFLLLAIGTGLEKTGAVDLIVSGLDPLLRQGSPLLVLFVIYFLAVALTELITNNAVAIVLTPIAIGVADNLGVDARPLVVAVMFGASACFATPIGYQTNTMVYGAGEYRFADFLRIGIPMNIIVGLATCAAIYAFMPLAK